jgi:branched-chain amino acid transport system ATP-binding protein
VHALKGVTITVDKGEIVALIGANGAAESTTLPAITGLKRPSKGEIHFEGERIDRLSLDQIVRCSGHRPSIQRSHAMLLGRGGA